MTWVPGGGDDQIKTQEAVREMLSSLEQGREAQALAMAKKFDNWTRPTFVLTEKEIEATVASLSQAQRDDIQFQQERVRSFAKAQMTSIKEFERESYPGVHTGQRVIPVNCAGCYVPGGRFSHVASATMTIVTAKTCGVKTVIACSPPYRDTQTIQPATLFAMKLAGADIIMCTGGVQAIATMAFGLFTDIPADILVGPGNKWVAEAKRALFGRVGIDMVAGPTEILCLADDSADSLLLATDLVSQAEHGINSPAWLITTSPRVANEVQRIVPEVIAELVRREPDSAAPTSWRDYGEIVLVPDRQEMARLSDLYAAEHLEVQCQDLDWWLDNLTNYGSLFLGEETCVSYGDKISGPNHVLPTKSVSRYTGGLSVDKFLKKLTWQRMDQEANREFGPATARISRMEGMEGHAMAADARLAKYFGGEKFALDSPAGDVAAMQKFRDQHSQSKL